MIEILEDKWENMSNPLINAESVYYGYRWKVKTTEGNILMAKTLWLMDGGVKVGE